MIKISLKKTKIYILWIISNVLGFGRSLKAFKWLLNLSFRRILNAYHPANFILFGREADKKQPKSEWNEQLHDGIIPPESE